MAKTRSQTGNITIKKEEEEEDCKRTLGLNSVTMTTRNKITKSKPSKRNNRHLPAQQVKVEEDTDIKSLLKTSSKYPKPSKGQFISQEQINQLIDAIVNDNMSISKAASKVNMSHHTGFHYFNLYKNDPDKKIPSPRNQLSCPRRFYTQEHIDNLIKYIVHEKKSVPQASADANMNYESGRRYYKKYLKDPNRNIPIPPVRQYYTQDQKNEFIGYIVNDKMNVKKASLKAKMNIGAGISYYHKYFDVQNPDIPTPSHIASRKCLTQEQIKEVIGYIINGKMSVHAASRKVNIDPTTAGKYYRQYLKDNNMEFPMLRRYTQDEINKVLGYIVDDKMTVKAASKKANVSHHTSQKYYMEYRKKHNIVLPALKYRQDKIKEIAGYVIDEKMSVNAAAKKANVSGPTGQKYYRKYLMDKKRDASS